MNIYQPYEVLADTEDCLHLKESESRERIQFTRYRILPLFLLFFLWFVLQEISSQVPMGWNYTLAAIVIIVSALLLSRSYLTEVKIIKNKEIFLVKKRPAGTKESIIIVADVEQVILERKNGRAVFLLQMRSKKNIILLDIPAHYIDDHHINLIKERLSDLIRRV